jgi:NADPH-dependent F420 reductase
LQPFEGALHQLDGRYDFHHTNTVNNEIIAVLGGTGKEGSGLAMRLALAGYTVLVGSREKEKAERKAAEYSEKTGKHLAGETNAEAVKKADIAILTVPSPSHKDMLMRLKDALQQGNKIFVDTTIFLDTQNFPKLKLPEEGSAALQAQKILGGHFPIVCAFQNISSEALSELEKKIEADKQLFSNDAGAKQLRGQPAERALLSACATLEALTSMLLTMCRIYKVKDAGIKITGIRAQGAE